MARIFSWFLMNLTDVMDASLRLYSYPKDKEHSANHTVFGRYRQLDSMSVQMQIDTHL